MELSGGGNGVKCLKTNPMAKSPWYMKTLNKGETIQLHWLWVWWQRLKIKVVLIYRIIAS
jgi:hypothetical protein